MTHFDVIAYSCGRQIGDIRSSADIWIEGGIISLCFKVCRFSATWETQSLKSNIQIKTVGHVKGVN